MKNLRSYPLLVLAFVLSITSCEKNDDKQEGCFSQKTETNNTDNFSDDIVAEFDFMEIYGDETTEIQLENDGFPEILDEFTFEDEATTTGKKRVRCNDIDLDRKQILQLRNAWENYLKCRNTSYSSLRVLHHKLINDAKKSRTKLLAAHRAGKLDKAQFRKRMQLLTEQLRTSLREQGQANRIAIAKCHKTYEQSVRAVLGAKSYEKWMHCLRSKLRLHNRR